MNAAGHPLDRYDWPRILDQLDAEGWAPLPTLFSAPQARTLAQAFDDPAAVRITGEQDEHRTLRPPAPPPPAPLPPLPRQAWAPSSSTPLARCAAPARCFQCVWLQADRRQGRSSFSMFPVKSAHESRSL